MFTRIPITTAGPKSIHADGLMVTSKRAQAFEAPDGLVGMYFTWDDIDAMKVAADDERKLQRSAAETPKLEVVR